jgi:hypothetical protein
MPTVARIGAIQIRFYYENHGVPHFHAIGPNFGSVHGADQLADRDGAGGDRRGASPVKNFALAFPGRLEIDRQQGALQQIDIAIEMFHRRQWACAITLALAAETQLPDPEKPFVWSTLRSKYGAEFIDKLNEPRNWLKHPKQPDTVTLYEMDAVIGLLRAISKFTSLYSEWSKDMAAFDAWVKQATTDETDSSD